MSKPGFIYALVVPILTLFSLGLSNVLQRKTNELQIQTREEQMWTAHEVAKKNLVEKHFLATYKYYMD